MSETAPTSETTSETTATPEVEAKAEAPPEPVKRSLLKSIDLPLAWLVFCGLITRAFRLSKPPNALVFDETYYVQAARLILAMPVKPHHLRPDAKAGLDPNSEHPPLAKLIIAGSTHLFGDDGLGWRLPSVILGTLSILLIYDIAKRIGASTAGARVAAFVLAFDNLAFVHGRIATLDIYVMTFMLMGTSLYLRRSYAFAGLAFGLATLSKINGIFGVVALGFYELGVMIHERKTDKRRLVQKLEPFVTMTGICFLLTFFGLGALDGVWSAQKSPYLHVRHIFRFGAALKSIGGPQGIESTPFQWWLNQTPIEYFAVRVTSNAATKTTILFRGAMTEYVIFAAPLAIAYAGFRAWRGSRHGLLTISMFVASYAPLVAAWVLSSRRSYIYYLVPLIPAIALGIGLLWRPMPRAVRWAFVVAVLYSFVSWFPFRTW